MIRPACQLYLITPPQIVITDFVAMFADALTGGPIAAVQLRLKDVPDAEILAAGKALRPLCIAHDIALIINDRADLAQAIAADGVHLGQSDGSVAAARSLLGHEAQIGVTCHASRDLAIEAGEAGADYVAFGAFYPTRTKEAPIVADPTLLTWWQNYAELPCVAIGGITVDNAKPLIRAGADFLAISAGIWQYPQGPAAAVRTFNQLLAD